MWLLRATFEVGGADKHDHTFSKTAFVVGGETGYTLPGGVTQVSADFDADNMTAGLNWAQRWHEEPRAPGIR